MATFGASTTNVNPNRSAEVASPPSDSVSSLCFSSKANHLIATSWDNQVLCSAWKDDGTTVFSGGCDKQVKMWPLLSGGQPVTVAMHDAPIKELAWIPEMSLLVTGSWDKTLRYWDLRQPNPTWVQQLPERCYALTVKHPLMVVGTADRNLVVFNLQNPQTEFKRVVSPLKYQTRCLAAFPDRQGFLVGSIEGRVGVHHLDDAQSSKNFTFKCHRDGNDIYSVNSLNFHPVHQTFATAGSDGAFNFWDKDSKQRLKAMLRFVTTGAKVLKITIHQQQRPIFTYISPRRLRSRANHGLEQAVGSEVSSYSRGAEVKGKPRAGTSGRK
ncbi:hypothetical protein SASPL_118566 [Salvia splendens]|uniref:mRNA export factor n=1 Tax=Salvia splendens TaxID=180675 RepID=A0A8X8XXZ4_SALSN|nr:hypothetical protein SASPL_118566 [Salvia splendens]